MRVRAPAFLLVALFLLVGGTVVGGALLASLEGTTFGEGVWLAFTVVSTTGFGDGPATTPGMIVVMGIFAVALSAYILMAIVAFEFGLRRFERGRLQRVPILVAERDVHRLLRQLSRN
ncbi:MAG: ion channel [Nitriliruptorales bacterium]